MTSFENCLVVKHLDRHLLTFEQHKKKILLQVSSEVALRRWIRLASIDAPKGLCLNGTKSLRLTSYRIAAIRMCKRLRLGSGFTHPSYDSVSASYADPCPIAISAGPAEQSKNPVAYRRFYSVLCLFNDTSCSFILRHAFMPTNTWSRSSIFC